MKRSGSESKKRFFLLVAAVVMPMVFMSGCSIFNSFFKSSEAPSASDRMIWHSREQSVRIVKQDSEKGRATLQNDHPIMLDPNQVRSALRALEVRLAANEKVIPVFTDPELDMLGSKLAEALTQASPDEDVVFVSVGQRRTLYGLAKQRKVTTGRAFYREGKLNIIFGKMIDDLRENVDSRLYPNSPGSRLKAASRSWILEDMADMQFYAGGDMIRSDWVILDLAAMAAHEATGTKPVKAEKGAEARVKETASTSQQELLPAVPASPALKGTKTIEDRLTTLNTLRDRKLITDEEYRAKRSSILNDL